MSNLRSSLCRFVRGRLLPSSCRGAAGQFSTYHQLIVPVLSRNGVSFTPSTSVAGGVHHQGCRWFHRECQLVCARFKLKVEKGEGGPGVEEGREEVGNEEDNLGFLKSHPYRQLANVWKSKSVLAQHLVDNVIHNDHGIFVTNKPFGVGVRKPTSKQIERWSKVPGGERSLHLRGIPTCPYTLEDLLPDLRHILGKPNLVLVRSTEKLTSGIAVFADEQDIADRFSKCVSASKVYYDTLYKYHVITVLPPFILGDPSKTERVGVKIKSAVGKEVPQPVLVRDYSKTSVKEQVLVPVHCQTRILQFGGDGGTGPGYLVEINTSSIAHNFLRIHCADKLAPILGDNLYSSRVRTLKGLPLKIDACHLTPGVEHQYLPEKMIQLLDLKKPENSLIVPAHVHLRSYKVRKFLTGASKQAVIEFEAPYPPYFKWTCEQLGILLNPDSIQTDDKQ